MGLSYDELAVALGKPSVGAARKAAQRAVVRLAEEIRAVEEMEGERQQPGDPDPANRVGR